MSFRSKPDDPARHSLADWLAALRGLDQIDLIGPFEVLSRIPSSTYRLYGKPVEAVCDVSGLRLTPDAALADAPQLDVLHVPDGFGQEALMEDEHLLAWIQTACRSIIAASSAMVSRVTQ
jgi:cyclohexyl-isocyanide hydratase